MADLPHFGIIVIGDEILSGKRRDVHLTEGINLLASRGLSLSWAEFLGDEPEQIIRLLRRTMATSDVVFSFGGLGATPDDLTRQSAAAASGHPLRRHAEAVALIEAEFGAAAYPKRVLMADLPQDARLIPNPINRVPGFALGSHYFMPGFPQMAHPMMAWVLDTYYPKFFHCRDYKEQSIKVTDAAESQLLDLMQLMMARYPAVKLFSLPRIGPQKFIELGLKGPTALVDAGMQVLCAELSKAGFNWTEFSP